MRYLIALAVALGVALGVAAVVYGESDDSPGLQLIGVLLAVAAVVLGVRASRRRHV
jgi:peptidoglycan/LPS O-acetylase OafA/YrhL